MANFMKTSRRNFFGKIGMAIAALATGCLAAKAVKPKWNYSNPLVERQAKILSGLDPEFPIETEENWAFVNPRKEYQQLCGDYQNLGFVAALMAAAKHANGNETVVFTKDPIKPFWIEQPLNPS